MKEKTFELTQPCPNCGNTKSLKINGLGNDWWITCPECDYMSKGGETLEAAVVDWNRGVKDGTID